MQLPREQADNEGNTGQVSFPWGFNISDAADYGRSYLILAKPVRNTSGRTNLLRTGRNNRLANQRKRNHGLELDMLS